VCVCVHWHIQVANTLLAVQIRHTPS